MLKLPVGIEDFAEIRQLGFYYIDKTKLIEQLLNGWGKVSLFTRPRRFGKSMAADMLAAYYERGEDAEELFADFAIGKAESFRKHLNQYDVLKAHSIHSLDHNIYALLDKYLQ